MNPLLLLASLCLGGLVAAGLGVAVAQMWPPAFWPVLGAVALIDEGETDWKVLAIDVEDPLAKEIDDIAGLEAKMPGKRLNQFKLISFYYGNLL